MGDGFLCIKADPGEYEIEFRFVQPGLIEGAIISLSAVIAIILFVLFLKKRKDKQTYIDLINGAANKNDDDPYFDSPVEAEIFEEDSADSDADDSTVIVYSDDTEEL